MCKRNIIIIGIFILLGIGYYFFQNQKENKETISASPEASKEVVPETLSDNALKNEVSFQALVERQFTSAPPLRIKETLAETSSYTKSAVTYESDTLTISGVLYVPKSAAPTAGYPVLVTNHGYIDPAVYTTGRGLKREQEYFASRGYVVLHPDYRNHAQSSKTDNNPVEDRLGYIVDILNAVESLKASSIQLNKNNITLLGHSMGGGATLAAALVKPDVANRIVLYAPVTVNYLDSYNRYQKSDPERGERVRSIYGSPEENPEFWTGLNGEPYFDRLAVPVQIYHGTNDADVPYEWSENTKAALEAKGKQVELITYQGEGHEFSFAWGEFMEGVLQFSK